MTYTLKNIIPVTVWSEAAFNSTGVILNPKQNYILDGRPPQNPKTTD